MRGLSESPASLAHPTTRSAALNRTYGGCDLFDRARNAEAADVDHQVVEVRIAAHRGGRTASRSRPGRGRVLPSAAARSATSHPFSRFSARGGTLGETRRTFNPRSRGKRNCAARPTKTACALRHRDDRPAQMHDVFLVRDDLVVHPRAEHIVDPVAARLVDQFEHLPVGMEAFGNVVQEIAVEDLPAEPDAELPAGLAAAGPASREMPT